MGKAKPKVVPNIEFDWVEAGGVFTRTEYARKYRLKCCFDMERMSNTCGQFYFKYGFYDGKQAGLIVFYQVDDSCDSTDQYIEGYTDADNGAGETK